MSSPVAVVATGKSNVESQSSAGNSLAERCRSAKCRACGNIGLEPILDLGLMPPSDRLLSAADLTRSERRFPLELVFCSGCSLVQILETVSPEFLFGEEYLY